MSVPAYLIATVVENGGVFIPIINGIDGTMSEQTALTSPRLKYSSSVETAQKNLDEAVSNIKAAVDACSKLSDAQMDWVMAKVKRDHP